MHKDFNFKQSHRGTHSLYERHLLGLSITGGHHILNSNDKKTNKKLNMQDALEFTYKIQGTEVSTNIKIPKLDYLTEQPLSD